LSQFIFFFSSQVPSPQEKCDLCTGNPTNKKMPNNKQQQPQKKQKHT